MDYSLWFWILVLVLSLGLAEFGRRVLARRVKRLMADVQQLQLLVAPLQQKLAEQPPELTAPVAAIDRDPVEIFRERNQILKQREAKRRARERRLLDRLKNLKFDKGRFR